MISSCVVKETIYVDESGNAVLNKPSHTQRYPFFVIGFAFCCDPTTLKIEMSRLIRKLHRQGKYHPQLKELKFNPYNALEKLGCTKTEIQNVWEPQFDLVRKLTNNLIVKYVDGVFAGVLDKRTIGRQTWTSETIGNFLFNRSLFRNILPTINFANTPDIIYDKGRLDPNRTQLFNKYMLDSDSYLTWAGIKKYSGNVISFKDEDSLCNSGIWTADLVAGSFRHAFLHNDLTYTDILKPKFIGSGSKRLWF